MLASIEKTVFISYRRMHFIWALAIFQDLERHGFDVFLAYKGLTSGEFENSILENITARAHFLVLLTPSSLERCSDPSDLFGREIEAAIRTGRNIVPIMLEGFEFDAPTVSAQLSTALLPLKRYQGIRIVPD